MPRFAPILLSATLLAIPHASMAEPVDVDQAVFTLVDRLMEEEPRINWEEPSSWVDRGTCETMTNGPEPVEVCVSFDFREDDVAQSQEWLGLPPQTRPLLSSCIPLEGRVAAALKVGRFGKTFEIASLVAHATFDAPSRSGFITYAASAREFLAGEKGAGFSSGTSDNVDPIERYAVDGAELEETAAMRSVSVDLRHTFRNGLRDRFESAGWTRENTRNTWREVCE